MTLPSDIESMMREIQKDENLSEVKFIAARELIIKLAEIKAEIIRDRIKEQLKKAA